MPKFSRAKTGHLIKGEVEFTVVKECAYFSIGGRIHSDELKVATFPAIEQAADCARQYWVNNPDPMETYKVYRHTKGKKAYSAGHFKTVPWQDYDYTNPKRT